MAKEAMSTKLTKDVIADVLVKADKTVKVSNDKLFVTEKQFVDLSNQAESAAVIKKIENTGITTTIKAYKILQSAAVNWLRHVEKYRDTRVLNDLIKRMESARVSPQPMGEFLMKFAPLDYDLEKGFLLNDSKPFDIKGAMSKPWWKTGKAPTFRPYSFEAALSALIHGYEKRQSAPKEGDKFNNSLFERVFRVAADAGVLDEDDSLNENEESSEDDVEVESEAVEAA